MKGRVHAPPVGPELCALNASSHVPLFVEVDHSLPLVDFLFIVDAGGADDAPAQAGRTALAARMLRKGTRRLQAPQVEAQLAGLGAELGIEVTQHSVRIAGSVIRRHLDAFIALLSALMQAPALRARDVAQLQRQCVAMQQSLLEHDQALAHVAFRQHLFGGHPYGRQVGGWARTLKALRAADLRPWWEASLHAAAVHFGFAGDLTPEDAMQLVQRHFAWLPAGKKRRRSGHDAAVPSGRRVRLVHQPGRSQAQLCIGTVGGRLDDADTYPMRIANVAFGGMFSAPLMQEVRAKRGWSYGASSRYGQGRMRDAWCMYTAPASADAAACAALQLDLMEAWVAKGPRAPDFRLAQRHLQHSHCFAIDTAAKRLEARMDVHFYGLPEGHYSDHMGLLGQVTRAEAKMALQRRLDPAQLCITAVADAAMVHDGFAALPGVEVVEVIDAKDVLQP
ncbi:MAG: M16 family metallopeptidase [Polyangiales bacterium]